VTALSGLDIEALSLWRGERMLFRDLAFSVRAGEALQLEGANGSGKTSLLRAIAGFLEPRAGTIRVRTSDGAFASGEERAEFIGWLGHQDGAKSQLTPLEGLSFYARYYGSAVRVEDALQRVGLSRLGDLPAQYLSA
jgi:heme exporter protein A